MPGSPPNTINRDSTSKLSHSVYVGARGNSQIDYVFGFLDSNIEVALTIDNSIEIEDKVI